MSMPRRYTRSMTVSTLASLHSRRAVLPRRAAALGLAMLAPVPLLGACSSYSSPEVSLAGARLVERTSDATLLELDLDASNAGGEPLKLRDIEYEARSGGEVFTGTRSAQAVIPPFSSRRVVLPVALPRDLGDGPYTIIVQGRMLFIPNSVIRDTMTDLGWPASSSPVGGETIAEAGAPMFAPVTETLAAPVAPVAP